MSRGAATHSTTSIQRRVRNQRIVQRIDGSREMLGGRDLPEREADKQDGFDDGDHDREAHRSHANTMFTP